jgi:hypothetical protein
MSDTANPFAQMFDLQRRAVEQSQRTFHQSMEFQKQMTHLATDSMESQRNLSRKGTDFARTAAQAYLDALETSVPGDEPAFEEMHAMVADQFDAMDEMTEDTWEAMERAFDENAAAYDEFVDRSLESVDDAVEMYLDTLQAAEDQSATVVGDEK